MEIQNGDIYQFSEAEQDWDLGRLFGDIEAKQLKKVTLAQQRNLKALLLGLSPKDVSPILNIEEKSLKPAFSALYRLIEDLIDQPERSVNHRNVPLVLAKYHKGAIIAIDKKFDLLGREVDRQKLEEFIKQYKIVLIKAGAGVGKSTLAREFLQTRFKKVIRIEMGLESGNVTPAEEKVSQILRKDFDEEPSRDFGINLDILREKLSNRANPIGVIIDNLEPALDENYRFREKLRGYDALLAMLGDRDIFSFTLITSRRSLITPRARVHEYSLKGLDITAWRQYFHDCENGVDSEALMQICVAYNGNAKVMDILHGAIKNRFDGNIGVYWNRYKDALLADSELETLISVEMDWLRDNQPDAYKLLFRMGCYRYQDVKTVPFEGLTCLLWDVPESRQIWVVDYLSKSSLIEVKGEYYLHPAVRESAKSHLLENKIDWEKANLLAAEFWTELVQAVETVDDAIKAFEAYHHYLAIDDINSACMTITKVRENHWERYTNNDGRAGEPLGHSYMRLGLLESVILAIQKVISRTGDQIILASATNLLGNLLWVSGKPRVALLHHKRTNDITVNAHDQSSVTKRFYYSSILNRGLCYLSLMEINEAHNFFLELKNSSLNGIGQNLIYLGVYNLFRANFCLSLTYSLINDKENTLLCIDQSCIDHTQQIAYTAWTRGYSLIFLAQAYKNIGLLKESNMKYQEAIQFADDSNYHQVKAIALHGIGELERINFKYFSALSHMQISAEILQKIRIIPDLAEVYFQLGLTYQAIGEQYQAEEYKAKALELFTQMEAPKQIERVNKVFGDNIQ